MKIFLSHASRDKPLVIDFKDLFPEFIRFWIDEESLNWGGTLEESIRKAIVCDVDFVVAFIGSDVLNSDWVRKELQWALEKENDPQVPFLLPIVMGSLESDEIARLLPGKTYLLLKDYGKASIAALAKEAQRHLFRIIAKDWSRNRTKTPFLPQTVILSDQASANEFIKQHIDYPKVKHATVIQYSSDMAKPAVEDLLKKRIAVDLYLKSPATAISELQSLKIDYNMKTYLSIWNCTGRENGIYGGLRIAFYRDIGTVRGFRFDDGSILVGIYHYTKDVIWGHDIPAFFCPASSANVESVLERFDTYTTQLETSELRDLNYYHNNEYL